jgi:hypothetical protein
VPPPAPPGGPHPVWDDPLIHLVDDAAPRGPDPAARPGRPEPIRDDTLIDIALGAPAALPLPPPRRTGRRKGRRLVNPADATPPALTPQQRLLL